MSMELVWSLTATTSGLAAVATLCLAWMIARRAARGRETVFLVAGLLALSGQYVCVALDGFIHLSRSVAGDFTIWSVAGQTFAILFWVGIILFLHAVTARLNPPSLSSRFAMLAALAVPLAIGLLACYPTMRCVLAMMHSAAPDLVRSELARSMRGLGSTAMITVIIAPLSLVNQLRDRVPRQDRTWEPISLGLSQASAATDAGTVPIGDFMILSRVGVTGLILYLILGPIPWTPWGLGLQTVLRLLLPASLMGIVFLQSRYLFFDVLLKRAILMSVSAAIMVTACFVFTAYVLRVRKPADAAFCLAATLLVWLMAAALKGGECWIDRVVFRRPDYRAEMQSVFAAMALCRDADSLREAATTALSTTLRADSVVFESGPLRSGSLTVPVGTRGYLKFGPRFRGQAYGSEDLTFAESVAAQFDGLLENIHARQLAEAAELRALRAQINPHFLFNALNTLAEMAKQQPDLERTVLNLSRIFRYALDSTRHAAVPLREELDAIRAYLEIEKERFEDKLRFHIEAPDDLLETPIPPMLIQPLVENAVKHGISPRLAGGAVRVSVARADSRIRVTVSDDGEGFDPARVTSGIGTENVRARVEKAGGTWHVESRLGYGTKVVFEL